MNIDSDFKAALQSLSTAEKDKLILRLLKKDVTLANKLRFELVDTASAEDKREELLQEIEDVVERIFKHNISPGHSLMRLRDLSGQITQHVAVTKDKVGEIYLNSKILCQMLQQNNERFSNESYSKTYTLYIYVVARMFKILMLIQKQHEDLHLDFKEDIVTIGQLIVNNHNIMKVAINNGLDVNWLIGFNIPNNIESIYKNLRGQGFLR
jgi:hypothetical protein